MSAETSSAQSAASAGSAGGPSAADPEGFAHGVARPRRAEEIGELRRDRRAMRGQRALEVVAARATHRERERVAFRGLRRQCLRLPVVAILQPVLDVAQVDIGVAQRGDGRAGEQAAIGDGGQRGQRAARTQFGLAPAADDLQGLHDELDLANAARPELDVRRVVVALALLRDLAVDVAQALVGIVVEVLAKDEGRDERVELVVPRAGHRARLEPGVALPRAPLRDQVQLERRIGHGQGPAFAIGAQPHVDAEDVAIRRDLLERRR